MSELAAKLARRRQLNGEGGAPPATVTVAPVTTPAPAPAPVVAPAAVASEATAAPPAQQARWGKEKTATIAVRPVPVPVQPQRAVASSESINIFSLASRENKVVMEHMKGEPAVAPVHMPRMQHLHHAPAAQRPPAPAERVVAPPVTPIVAVETVGIVEEAIVTADTTPGEETAPAPAAVSTPTVPLPATEKAPTPSASAVTDATDMDDLAGFEGFLDSLDDSRFEKKAPTGEGACVRRGSSQPHMESAAGPGGSLFVDDEDLDVGLAGGSSDVFSLSAQQSVDSAGEDDEGDHRGPSDGARLTKRRSRFGSHDLLEKYGFGEEDIGDAVLSMTENNDVLLGAAGADNSAEDINSLFSQGASSTLREELGSLHSLGGYQALLASRRDDTANILTPSVDSVKAAHSRLNTFGLFGDEPEAVDTLEATGAKNGGHPSSGNLFKDDVNFSQQTRRGAAKDAEETSETRWNERKAMAYDDFLVIMQLPACLPMWDAVQRFLYSVLGDGDGMLDAKKNLFEKVSKLETFQGTRDLDVRCQNFFDDMVDYWSKHAMFKDCHEELHMSMRDCLERYVMGKLSAVAMKYVEDRDEDERLLHRMELLSFVTPEALDVRPGLRNDIIWELAASELRKMNSFSLPVDKIACVVRCAAILFRSLNLTRAKGDDNAAGADDFLPVFIYVVMHSNVQKLHTNCEYIQQFHNPAHLMSKAGYCFVNLRSAMEFVLSADASSVSMDPVEFDSKFNEAQRRVDARVELGRLPISPIAVQKDEVASKVAMRPVDEAGLTNGLLPAGPPITPIKDDESTAVCCPPAIPCDITGVSSVRVETVVVKGSMGIGLDISASAESGRAVVRRFKNMPPGVVNPATNCDPPIVPADIIVAVNGRDCSQLGEVVAAIKSSGEQVRLTLERTPA